MSKVIISMKDVSYSYDQGKDSHLRALRNIDLDIFEGEFVAIIGRNGSGKSTLAKLLNALLIPTHGEVRVTGLLTSDEANLWSVRQRAGMVFQNPDNQIVATTVEEDVAFGLENLGVPREVMESRISAALAAVGMQDYRYHPPHLLSGGQKQRVAIAGITAMRPEVLILDEPTAMLDPRGRQEVMDTVITLNKEGVTVIYVTHFMEEVVHADKVVVMDDGEIKTQGTPETIFSGVQALRSAGLDVPQIVELCHELRESGISIPGDIMTIDALVNVLC